jgi:acyl dehydratase
MQTVPVDTIPAYIGQELGKSDWLRVDQDRINAFADTTLDHQFIHVDPEAARMTPWGSTIAHGFLTLSLIPYLTGDIGIVPEDTVMVIKYGSDKVRFLEPVKVGSAVRARVFLSDASEKGPGRILFKTKVTIEIRDSEKPALVADMLSLYILEVTT